MKFSDLIDTQTGTVSRLSVLAIGCSQLGSFGARTPLSDTRAMLQRALELGINVFDTADIYGQGDSERELGRLLKGRREAGFVITKLGKGFSAKMKLLAPFKPILKPLLQAAKVGGSAVADRREGQMREDFSPATFAAKVDGSRRRLGFDQLDALLLHSPPASVPADPAVGAALADLKAAGKLHHFGVSCDDKACLLASLPMPGLSLLQLPLNLYQQALADGLGDQLRQKGITVLVREVIRSQPDTPPVEAVRRAAALDGMGSVIVGTSRRDHLEALAAAVSS